MTVSVSSPVTGGAQTGFTSPTYTLTTDTPPNASSKQWAVTALGGTQTGVNAHDVSSPFTITVFRPSTYKRLGQPNPVTGVVSNVPKNRYEFLVRKGVLPLAGQPSSLLLARISLEIPAGSENADPANIRAALSLLFGAAWSTSAGIGDTTITGIL